MAPVTISVRGEKAEQKQSDHDQADSWKTILFNCDCHTFDEVEKIVMKAIRCTLSRARQISHEVNVRGNAAIYLGHRERCETVADVVASIGLRVKVVQ